MILKSSLRFRPDRNAPMVGIQYIRVSGIYFVPKNEVYFGCLLHPKRVFSIYFTCA